MNCRECKFCDEISGDYILQCTNPEVKEWYFNKWPNSHSTTVMKHNGRDEESPCGPEALLIHRFTSKRDKIEQQNKFAWEKDFWDSKGQWDDKFIPFGNEDLNLGEEKQSTLLISTEKTPVIIGEEKQSTLLISTEETPVTIGTHAALVFGIIIGFCLCGLIFL